MNAQPATASAGQGDAGPAAAACPLPAPLMCPDYGSACLDSLVPALLAAPGSRPAWVPRTLQVASQVVLLVVDGLGWLQLQDRASLAPVLCGMEGGPITSVAPTTTATALSSLTLGMAPAAHGILGYKLAVPGPGGTEVLNVLRWSTPSGDARARVPPTSVQPHPAFLGHNVPVVTRADFASSGFSQAHQGGAREVGWVVASSLPVLVRGLLEQGEPLVYAYYDGVDKIAHAAGLGALYEAELGAVDLVVAALLAVLPPGAALAVTADHGQVEVGPRAEVLVPEVAEAAGMMSGEGRFRWLHAREGKAEDLADRARGVYSGEAWVASRDEVVASGVFGGSPSVEALERLGDVALVPLGANAYLDARDLGEVRLVCRHGGLLPDEVLVPLLAGAP